MIRFGGTDRGETSVGNKIIVENFAVKSGFVLLFYFFLFYYSVRYRTVDNARNGNCSSGIRNETRGDGFLCTHGYY